MYFVFVLQLNKAFGCVYLNDTASRVKRLTHLYHDLFSLSVGEGTGHMGGSTRKKSGNAGSRPNAKGRSRSGKKNNHSVKESANKVSSDSHHPILHFVPKFVPVVVFPSKSPSGGTTGGSEDSGKGVAGGSEDSGKGVAGGSEDSGKGVAGGSEDGGKGVAGGSEDGGKGVAGGSEDGGKGVAGGMKMLGRVLLVIVKMVLMVLMVLMVETVVIQVALGVEREYVRKDAIQLMHSYVSLYHVRLKSHRIVKSVGQMVELTPVFVISSMHHV